jgi:hypothetical protein
LLGRFLCLAKKGFGIWECGAYSSTPFDSTTSAAAALSFTFATFSSSSSGTTLNLVITPSLLLYSVKTSSRAGLGNS